MNSGIYALYWWEQDLVYVGLTSCLSRRYTEHLYQLRRGTHSNYKVQNAYNSFGTPEFIVLEHTQPEQLHLKEIEWCEELDALGKNGLCIVEPGIVGSGVLSNNSKYQKLQILKVFSLLCKNNLSISLIAKRTSVSESTIKAIQVGRQHTWLRGQYTDKYDSMVLNTKQCEKTKIYKECITYKIVKPDGQIEVVSSLLEFCKTEFKEQYRSAYSILSRVALGNTKNKSYKKYTAQKVY